MSTVPSLLIPDCNQPHRRKGLLFEFHPHHVIIVEHDKVMGSPFVLSVQDWRALVTYAEANWTPSEQPLESSSIEVQKEDYDNSLNAIEKQIEELRLQQIAESSVGDTDA